MIRWPAHVAFVATSVVVIVVLGLVHAEWIGDYRVTASDRLGWVLVYAVVCAVVGYAFGLPDQFTMRGRIRAAAATAIVAPVVFATVQVVVGGNQIPRFVLAMSVPGLFLADVLVSTAIVASSRSSADRDRVLVVGDAEVVARVIADVAEHVEVACTIVGSLAPSAPDTADALGRLGDSDDATVVVVSSDAMADDSLVSVLSSIHAGGVRVRTVSAFYDEWLGKVPLRELGAAALLFDIRGLHHVGYTRLSRLGDLVLAVLGLVVFILAIPFVAIGNVFGNRGPLFFRQERVGRDQRTFSIIKFRTMTPGSTNGEWTSDDDPRVTPFGGFLRRSHLDELPQVVNILTGDLSMIGPRPEQPRYVDELARTIPFYRTRHVVRPGLTGWAQVNYPYGADEIDAYEKLQYELWYLGHQSLALDLRILARTVRHIVGSRGR